MDFELSEEELVDAGFPISDVIHTKLSVDKESGYFWTICDEGDWDLTITRNKDNGFTYTIPDEILFKYWNEEESGEKRPLPAYIVMGGKCIEFIFP